MGFIFDELKQRFPNYPNLKVVEEFVDKVVKDLDPLLIIMFGALPRGDYTFNSDVDALLIMDKPITWNEVYSYGGGVVQPISKTRDDFVIQLKRGNPFFIQIMEEGIILHAKEGILEDFKLVASETISEMRMTRVERGWEIDEEDEIDQDD
ncbi:nucleotidyltransferase domain-containing protein [bacterium]|nr:nucleotidyltransferase domain-containing protein [candidate division CSSED10-310 bacterium]